MVKKILKCNGDLFAIEIDHSILELLSINEDTPLTVRAEGDHIVIEKKKIGIISDDPNVQKMFEEIIEQYDDDFKKLAKT